MPSRLALGVLSGRIEIQVGQYLPTNKICADATVSQSTGNMYIELSVNTPCTAISLNKENAKLLVKIINDWIDDIATP